MTGSGRATCQNIMNGAVYNSATGATPAQLMFGRDVDVQRAVLDDGTPEDANRHHATRDPVTRLQAFVGRPRQQP